MSVLHRMIVMTALCIMSIASTSFAATQAQIDTARNKGFCWLMTNQAGDGSWKGASGLGVQSTAAVLDAMRNAGIKQGYAYGMAQGWLGNAEALSTDALARQISALARTGSNVKPLYDRLNGVFRNSSKAWGAYPQYGGSFPDTSLALDAILAAQQGITNQSTSSASSASSVFLPFIEDKINTDGGWPYAKSDPGTPPSRVIPTAHNLLTLSRYRLAGSSNSASITKAVDWLLARQKPDGGFNDDPNATFGNAYETAIAYLALTEAKKIVTNAAATSDKAQSVRDNALTFLINQQDANGSWRNDPLQTALALQALPAPPMLDSDKDGIPDAVELLLNTNPYVADSGAQIKGNGQGASGSTIPVLLATALQHFPFSVTLPASSGTSPVAWGLLSGSLPDGLSLTANNGLISGTPTIVGTFNFIYTVSDASNHTVARNGQIVVDPLEPAVAAFTANATTVAGPFNVELADQSQRATSWAWDFGDGATSTAQNPSHVYKTPGAYTITLTASNVSGSTTAQKSINVSICQCE